MILSTFALVLALGQGVGAESDTSLLQYEVNGLRVVHQRRPAATNVIAVELFLLGGSRQVTSDNAGIEPLLLEASRYGTKKYPGDNARRALAKAGTPINVLATSDWTTFCFHGLKQDFDSAWAVFADRLMQPTLDSTSIETVRTQMLTRIGRRSGTPEDYAFFLADSLAFTDHPYAVPPNGTERSLRALDAAALRAYAREQLVTSRMVLVVVGDLSRATVERAVVQSIGTLPRGSYQWTLPEQKKAVATQVAPAMRAARTNYVAGTMLGPQRAGKDFAAFERAMDFLGGAISYVIREREGLSYSAGIVVNDRGAPAATIYFSTTRPDTVVKLVNRLFEVFTSDVTIPRWVLREGAKGYSTAYVRQTETADGWAALLGRALLYDGDATAAARRGDVMGKLAFGDLRRSAREYAKNIHWSFVGDTALMPRDQLIKKK